MWLVYFINYLNSSLTANLSAYITSDFSEHSLLSVIAVVTSVMGAACLMPIAKVLNLWDRITGFIIMLVIAIMGLIMMAGCNNIATYCAAQVCDLAGRQPKPCWLSLLNILSYLLTPIKRHSTQLVLQERSSVLT